MSQGFNLAYCSAQYTVTETTYSINAGGATKILKPNPNRIAAHFCDSAGAVWIGKANVAFNGPAFIQMINPNVNFLFHYSQFGPAVQEDWYAIRGSGISSFSVIEVLWVPSASGG